MREIKFRGKGLDGIWRTGDLVRESEFVWIDSHEVDVESVGQFTGLKDVDGKEIYEGDIIDFLKGDELCDTPCYVCWHPYLSQFYMCFSYDIHPNERDTKASLGDMIYQHGYKVKILGNIYDNPDLLPDISPYMICGGK